MALKTFRRVKHPDELLDYGLNWKRRLKGDAILTSNWTIEEGDTSQLQIEMAGNTDLTTTLWVSGGLDRKIATVRNTITTQLGRTMIQVVAISIREA